MIAAHMVLFFFLARSVLARRSLESFMSVRTVGLTGLVFEGEDEGAEPLLDGLSWRVMFKTSHARDIFLGILRPAWKELFQIDLPVFDSESSD
eukprot:m.34559 g.34559  ORF g.34559 m.34559 type:complete len:93 (+) comp5673_c0_seq2:2445-2723(+)